MKAVNAIVAVTLFAVSTSSALANAYIGLDGSSMSVDNSFGTELNPHGARLRLGARVSQTFDLELHLGGGSESDTVVADRFSAAYMGAFLKGYLPLGQRSALFGLAGVSAVEFTQTRNGQDFSDDRSGFSYGFGLETQLTERLDLSADYVHYVSGDGPFTDVSTVNLGIKLYF